MVETQPLSIYLVQRLCKPQSTDVVIPEGMSTRLRPNYTCSAEEKAAINALFKLDYMGSAEYEFGSFGKATREMALAASAPGAYSTFTLKLTGKAHAFWKDERWLNDPDQHMTVYGFCPAAMQPYMEELINLIMMDDSHDQKAVSPRFSVDLKENAEMRRNLFGEYVRPRNRKKSKLEPPGNIHGWLDIVNLWFMTRDKAFYLKSCELFGLNP